MISEEDLALAAAAIRHMPKAELAQRLSELEAERQRRSDFSAATQESDFDSTQLDEAAYRLAGQYRADGKLTEAARWYRTAALNDYADAALQLGYVLECLAERYIEIPGNPQVIRDELTLVEDASHWYVEALGAGYFEEAAARLDIVVSRHNPNRPRPAPGTPVAMPAPDLQPCHQGGLEVVNTRCPVELAARHITHCAACQQELLDRSGVLPPAASPRHPQPPRTDAPALPAASTRELPQRERDLRGGRVSSGHPPDTCR
jgi:hypothetical protein